MMIKQIGYRKVCTDIKYDDGDDDDDDDDAPAKASGSTVNSATGVRITGHGIVVYQPWLNAAGVL